MKKFFFSALLSSILGAVPGLLFGQSVPDPVSDVIDGILDSYPTGTLAQVFDLSVKAGLSAEAQISVADLITERDIKIVDLLRNRRPDAEIVAMKASYADKISELLGLEQKYERYVKTVKEKAKDKYTYSQFAIAIRYKDTLGLSQMQTTAIYNYIDTLKQLKNQHYATHHKSLDTRAYESTHISTILTESQYTQLLIFKNQSKAEAFAESDWAEVQQRGLDSTYVKEEVLGGLTTYYVNRESVYNRYQHDPVTQKAKAKELYGFRPQVLRALQKARRNPDNNTQGQGYRW